MKKTTLLGIILLLVLNGFSQTEIDKGLSVITESAIKGQLEFLASDWTEGREVGTKGAYLAADYISSMFKVYGIKPYGDETTTYPTRAQQMAGAEPITSKTYFQNFSLIQYTQGDIQKFSIVSKINSAEKTINFNYKTDFSIRTGSVGISVKAPMVFVGYGFTDKEEKYDDLKKIDLKGKIAVVLQGFPGHLDTLSEAYQKFHPTGRYGSYYLENQKIKAIEKMGALAVISINQSDDFSLGWAQNQIYPIHGRYYEADKRLKSYYDTRVTLPKDTLDENITIVYVTKRVGNEIIAGTSINFDQFEKNAQAGNKTTVGPLSEKMAAFKTIVNSKIVKARNVIGYIEGENKNDFIVVGAHYDHLGKFDGWIWNGADDNASGTVGVMTIAKAFMATGKKPQKSIIFAAWTGEEKGLFGSKYFVDNIPDKDTVVLSLNYDMIARNQAVDSLENKAMMVYTEANKGIRALTESNLEKYKINLDVEYKPSLMPSGGSDHAPFAKANIPVFYFMAAMHPDYHQPSDELDKINWEKMANIIRIGFLNTWNFSNSDEFLKKE